ncbi:MAG: undecaprenyldiphospho-muramoylpentapeptide beta-N-acetylglucosaminyltransferase [Halanaerobiaceae bacterium]
MKKIVLTGGGTAGHVMPNLALIPSLIKKGWRINYIGSYRGIERELLKKYEIPYYPISSGKFRRYFSPRNFTDPFRVLKGIGDSIVILGRIKPGVIFSKGGFVSVPVVLAARLKGIPVILHESDLTPGLANRILVRFATRICATFPETLKYLPADKAVLTGNPIREEILQGSKEKGYRYTGFVSGKPVLLVIGGSLGSVTINKSIREILSDLLAYFQVVHICGKGNIDKSLEGRKGYFQVEFIMEELPAVLAVADIVVSRAGANFIFELLALAKPNLLIPLSRRASRGDQIHNARSFEQQGFSDVLEEEKLTSEKLLQKIKKLYSQKDRYEKTMCKSELKDAKREILRMIEEICMTGPVS